jgi:DNA-binding winged helix-turn-helix (wHTH) protein/tetratricopeptide (TPR) repeat protein
MSYEPPLRFDAFELDEANALLTRDGKPVALPPKAFTLLCVLARNAGRLASKDALLDAVWGHRHVSESVLKTTIAQVRAALADDAGEPRYVETVARRGYRFIGRVGPAASVPSPARSDAAESAASSHDKAQASPATAQPLPPMIGRQRALARLHASWRRADAGERQLVWVAGEAGIGKSTLLDRFVGEIGTDRCALGQCVEQLGAGEPYLPVLEALKALSHRDPELAPLMRHVAPTWLLQMPWLIADADRGALHAELAGAGQERMVREIWELMERYTQRRPLLLVTEDLHWSDQGTLRLMDHFARRRSGLRLLWVATFRLTQVIAEEHPLQNLRQELQLHRLTDELLLDPFSEAEVAEYVATRVPGQGVSESFVRTLHQHTDGLPLFIANVVDALLAPSAAGHDAGDRIDTGSGKPLPVPDNLTGAIEKRLVKLPAPTRAVLEAASVCGMEFRAATVAELLELEARAVVASCDDLVRRQYWLREAGIAVLPDGTLDPRYAFRHAVYKHVFYQRLTAARRVELHRGAARSLARGRALGVAATSAELASHHELGREHRAAIEHYTAAAEGALAHFAPDDALNLTAHALELLQNLPDNAERRAIELALLAPRSIACANVFGVSGRESVEVYARVRDLYDELPPTPVRALLLNGIGLGMYTRGEFADALAMGERIHEAATQFGDAQLFILACNLMGITLTTMGRAQDACDWLRKGLDAWEKRGGGSEAPLLFVDPEVSLRANISFALAQLGLYDQSRAERAKSMERAEQVRQPMARVLALWCYCMLGIRLDEEADVLAHVAKLDELVAATRLHQGLGPAAWCLGWAEMRRGRRQEGYKKIMEGYAVFERLGMYAGCTEVLGYAAEAQLLDGRISAARSALDAALSLAERIGERGVRPELLLLDARIRRSAGDTPRASIDAAVREARALGALGSELKARIAMAELEDRTAADLAALRATYARMTEGFDTSICARARELLATEI